MERCTTCTAVLTPVKIVEAHDESYYASQYSLTATVRASTEYHRHFRFPEYIKLIADVQKIAPAPRRWLDVGCDHGFFLDEVRRYGYTAAGVEVAQQPRRYAQEIGLNVFERLDDVTDTYDIVSLWHVLEHIPTPLEFLTKIHDRMSPDGVLRIRVPDAGSLPSRLLSSSWIWFQPHHHVVHYTTSVLHRVVTAAGFDIVRLRTQRPNTLLTRRSYRLARSVFRKEMEMPTRPIYDYLARTWQDLTGVELDCVARRR